MFYRPALEPALVGLWFAALLLAVPPSVACVPLAVACIVALWPFSGRRAWECIAGLPLTFLFLCYVSICAVVTMPDPGFTIPTAITCVLSFSVFFAAPTLARREWASVKWIVAGGVILLALFLLGFAFVNGIAALSRPGLEFRVARGAFGRINPNSLALLTGASIVLFAAFRWPRRGRAIAVLAASIAAVLTGLTFSTSGVGALICALFVMAAHRRGRIAGYLALALAAGILLSGVLHSGGSGARSALEVRMDIWRGFLALSLERPIFGWGFNAYPEVMAVSLGGVPSPYIHAHNVLLQILAQGGWVGVVLTFAMIGELLIKTGAGKQLPRGQRSALRALIVFAVVGGLALSAPLVAMPDGRCLLFWVPMAALLLTYHAQRAASSRRS